MTDQELLEFAAKAGRVALDCTASPGGESWYCSRRNALARADGGWFAPLADDGDALRLFMAIHGELHTVDGCEGASLGQVYVFRQRMYLEQVEHHGGDACAAARRAIVRAAADLGRNLA